LHTISNVGGIPAERRRKHSVEFKAQVVAACCAPGASVAAVSMAHGVNANMARRWIVQARQLGSAQSAARAVAPVFIPVRQQPAEPVPADVRIELRHGTIAISVSWPCDAAAQCAAWMRELLR